MTDRREAVARAIWNADRDWCGSNIPFGWGHPETNDRLFHLADAVLAALDQTTVYECSECGGIGQVVEPTEPTEAELDAAIDRAIHELVIAAMESADASDGDIGSVTRIVAEQRLRELIAARKVQP